MIDHEVDFMPPGSRFMISQSVREQFALGAVSSQNTKFEHGGLVIAIQDSKAKQFFNLQWASFEKGESEREFKRKSEVISFKELETFIKAQNLDISSVFYAGEWHSHVVNTLPSTDDTIFIDRYQRALLFIISKEGFRVVQRWERGGIRVSEIIGFSEEQIFEKMF